MTLALYCEIGYENPLCSNPKLMTLQLLGGSFETLWRGREGEEGITPLFTGAKGASPPRCGAAQHEPLQSCGTVFRGTKPFTLRGLRLMDQVSPLLCVIPTRATIHQGEGGSPKVSAVTAEKGSDSTWLLSTPQGSAL